MNNPLQTPTSKGYSKERVRAGLDKRMRRERRFRLYGYSAIVIAMLFLLLLLGSIIGKGYSAFVQTYIQLDIHFDSEPLGLSDPQDAAELASADYAALIKKSLAELIPEAQSRSEKRQLHGLISSGAAFSLGQMVVKNPGLIGNSKRLWLAADDEIDMLVKGHIDRHVDEEHRRVSNLQIAWIDKLQSLGRLEKHFNSTFFTSGDSREPEMAGILGALMGSLYTLMICFAISFPIAIATAIYLEEFAPKNVWTDMIEVNINNLAAVPSIVFGLLGLAVFINFLGLERSVPLVGGLVLALMTLPTIIIAARAALKSVPPSIREAALGIGASRMQTVAHHVLPLSMPGILTGTIIGMAQALGETAPLLMIGMVAFIVDIPGSALDPATVLPVQIFLWADSPERAFVEKTSAAIIVLLLFLAAMNILAIFLRRRFERRW